MNQNQNVNQKMKNTRKIIEIDQNSENNKIETSS